MISDEFQTVMLVLIDTNLKLSRRYGKGNIFDVNEKPPITSPPKCDAG